jgi:hypothetical protein
LASFDVLHGLGIEEQTFCAVLQNMGIGFKIFHQSFSIAFIDAIRQVIEAIE